MFLFKFFTYDLTMFPAVFFRVYYKPYPFKILMAPSFTVPILRDKKFLALPSKKLPAFPKRDAKSGFANNI